MTIPHTELARARDLIAAIDEHASSAARALAADLTAARILEDPTLSPEGLRDKRATLVAQAQNAARATEEAQRREANRERDFIRSLFEQNRPRISDWSRSQAAWNRVTMQLNQGHRLHQVLRLADLHMVLAIEENGPAWLRSQSDPADAFRYFTTNTTPDPADRAVTALQAAVLERLAETTADSTLSILARATVEADDAIALAEPWWRLMRSVAAGRSGGQMTTAVESRILRQGVVSRRTPEASNAA